MVTLASIIVHLLEGAAVTGAIYLVTKRALDIREIFTLVLTISVTFMVLDLFAPTIGAGARQGSGFGLGFMQIAGDGNTMPRRFYDPSSGKIIEGMDDPVAVQYYNQYNSHSQEQPVDVKNQPNLIVAKDAQVPSVILQEYAKSPFDTDSDNKFAPFPN